MISIGNARRPKASVPLVVCLGLLLAFSGCTFPFLGGSQKAKDFRAAVRPASGDIARLLRNAHYLKLSGRPELALKELEEAHQLAPGNLKVLDTLARGYEELGDFSRAQKLYQEALARDSSNPALQNNYCFSLYQSGHWKQAEDCFRQALARDPNNREARNNLGLLLCRSGRSDEALSLWREVEGDAMAQNKLNQVMASLGMKTPPAYLQMARPQPAAPAPPPRVEQTAAAVPAPAPRAAEVRPPATVTPAAPVAAAPLPRPAPPVKEAAKAEAPRTAAAAPPPASAPAVAAAPPMPAEAEKPAVKPEPASPLAVSFEGVSIPEAMPLKGPAAPAIAAAPPAEPSAPQTAAPAPATTTPPSYLTAAELINTSIVVLNGAGSRHLARKTRLALSIEGFNVARIGNYRHFGVPQTKILYRPGTERVAQALNAKFLQTSLMEQADLPQRVDIKVVLGHDQAPPRQILASAGKEIH